MEKIHEETMLEVDVIHLGNCQELTKEIPDNSVDLVFTDPPYGKKHHHLYEWLAEEAARILKPNRFCLTLSGTGDIPAVLELMGKHLDWFWMGGMGHTIPSSHYPTKNQSNWKPLHFFQKGRCRKEDLPKKWTVDFMLPERKDKRFHAWGQPGDYSGYYIARFTSEGDLVFDPFCGGGTTAVACLYNNRRFVLIEKDHEAHREAVERLEEERKGFFTVPKIRLEGMIL